LRWRAGTIRQNKHLTNHIKDAIGIYYHKIDKKQLKNIIQQSIIIIMSEDKKPLRPKKLKIEDIRDGCITLYGEENEESKLCMVQEEFRQGIDMIQSFSPSVTFYGSARLPETHPDYIRAQEIAKRIVEETGAAILSGGGGGIMEAANRGAYEAGGRSVGLTIKLPFEQKTNPYVTDEIPFYFFFTRKVSMSYTTEACLFFAGGFGTFDELFEMLTLVQTKKITNVPIILVGKDFWGPFQMAIQQTMIEKYETVGHSDLSLYTITDDIDEIINIIKHSKKEERRGTL
jgi:uncharacterized protein (TIGR00730 family)